MISSDCERGAERQAISSPEEAYRIRCDELAEDRRRLSRRWDRFANARLAVFGAAVLCAGWGIWQRAIVGAALALILFVSFAWLVRCHDRIDQQKIRCEELWRINDEAIKRLNRAWNDMPLRHTVAARPDHPYADDLNLFGHASLFHILDSGATPMGEMTLSQWLLEPATPEVIRRRQASVVELAPHVAFRDELVVRLRLQDLNKPDPEPFLAWAEGDGLLLHSPVLIWIARMSPLLCLVSALAQVSGFFPYPAWIIFITVDIALIRAFGRRPGEILSQISSQEGALHNYVAGLQILSETSFCSDELKSLQDELANEKGTAYERLQRLRKLARLILPQSALIHAIIQPFTLWDIHVLAALERWQETAGAFVRQWLFALGKAEALTAFATLAHDNPDWVFPVVDSAEPTLDARNLGHPLLPQATRVRNDVSVGPAGTFLLVTGSNMSGKSTLLRAIGVNAVLAGAGGPVCASAFRMPPVALWTSMRIQDSLERGVSYFMAELQRLKAIIDSSRQTRAQGTHILLYLLDELLQGTNTAERQVAARRIIMYLVAHGALGAVSTHDLSLADAPDIDAAARAVHLTDTISRGFDGMQVTFDYRLRPGTATSTNALRLMEIVGLDLRESEVQ